jgi:predicted DNA-binding protein
MEYIKVTGIPRHRKAQIKILATVKGKTMSQYVKSLIADALEKISDPEMESLTKRYNALTEKDD